MNVKRKKQFQVAENGEYEEIDSVNSNQLSHPLWVTLYQMHEDLRTRIRVKIKVRIWDRELGRIGTKDPEKFFSSNP